MRKLQAFNKLVPENKKDELEDSLLASHSAGIMKDKDIVEEQKNGQLFLDFRRKVFDVVKQVSEDNYLKPLLKELDEINIYLHAREGIRPNNKEEYKEKMERKEELQQR